jgi:hypothetical protein
MAPVGVSQTGSGDRLSESFAHCYGLRWHEHSPKATPTPAGLATGFLPLKDYFFEVAARQQGHGHPRCAHSGDQGNEIRSAEIQGWEGVPKVHIIEEPAPAERADNVINLMDALRQSPGKRTESGGRKRRPARSKRGRKAA